MWPAFPTSDYYDPLRLPLGALPLPGFAGYRRASLPITPQATGPRRLSRVPRTTLRTFNAQLRRRVPQRPLLDPRRFPWPSPLPNRLGTLYPRPQAGTFDDAYSGFTRVADRTVASALLRTRPLDHARGLPGTQTSPRTGLTPAGHPELIAPTPWRLLPSRRRSSLGARIHNVTLCPGSDETSSAAGAPKFQSIYPLIASNRRRRIPWHDQPAD